jgi:proteasome lid subunit RPN8/RPN11
MVEPISKPLPIAERSVTHQRIGTIYRDSTLVFIDSRVIDDILDYSCCDLRCEIGGFLVGGYYQDQQSYIEIKHFMPALDARSRAGSLTFTHETWSQANADIRRDFPDERIVGWHHTHPGLGLFLSEYDLFIHRNFFSEPWQIAMVVDPREREFVVYQWRDGKLIDCGFVCVSADRS